MVPVGACICKRMFNEAIAALQQARSLQPKEASILFALGEANSSKKSTTRRFKKAGLKLKPNDPEGL